MMNERVYVMRQAIQKLTPMLAGRGIRVTQQGITAYVRSDASGRPILVNLPFMPDNATEELIEAIQGFLDHEVAHILFTDFTIMQKVGGHMSPIGSMLNIIEDTRIERCMTERFEGSAYNLSKTGKFFLEKYTVPKMHEAIAEGDNDRLIAILTVPLIRSMADQAVFKEFMKDHMGVIEPVYEKIKDLQPRIAKCGSTEEAAKLAQEVIKRLRDGEPSSGAGDGAAGAKGGAGGAKGKGSGKGKKSEGKDEEKSKGASAKKPPKAEKPEAEEESDDAAGGGEKPEEEKPEAGEEPEKSDGAAPEGEATPEEEPAPEASASEEDEDEDPTPEEDEDDEEGEAQAAAGGEPGDIDEDDDALVPPDADTSSKAEGEGENDIARRAALNWNEIDKEIANDFDETVSQAITDSAAGAASDAEYLPFTTDEDVIEPLHIGSGYNDRMLTELMSKVDHMVAPLQKDLERAISARSLSVYSTGHRSGRLHPANLARLAVRTPAGFDDRVFRRKHEANSKDVAVELVIDISGSMRGSKVHVAVQTAYCLAQTLERIGIKCEVICFTTGKAVGTREILEREATKLGRPYSRYESLYMPILKGWDERLGTETKKRFAWLPNISSMASNVDGESVMVAARRLMVRRETGKVLIVLSDGYPAASGGGAVLKPHLKKTVKDIMRAGVSVVGIGIESDAVREFYPRNVVMNDVSELPNIVMKELRALIVQ